jgi:hypothetical protein
MRSLGAGNRTDESHLRTELQAKDQMIARLKASAKKLADGYKALLTETLDKQRLERETS